MRLSTLLLLAIPLAAQSVLTVAPTSCVFKEGDDPAWARPDFDDRDWSPTRPDLNRLATSPYLWMRCRLDLRPLARTGPFSVQFQAEAAWEMFIEGEPAGTFGDIGSGRFTMDIVQRRPVPQSVADRNHILVALRVVERGRPAASGEKMAMPLRAGAAEPLDSGVLRLSVAAIGNRFYSYLFSGIIGVGGLFLLILSGVDRARRELLWLSLSCFSVLMLRANELAQALHLSYPDWLSTVLFLAGNVAGNLSYIWFFFAIAARPVGVAFRLVFALRVIMLSVPALASLFGSVTVSQFVVWWSWLDVDARTIKVLILLASVTAPVAAFWPLWRVPRELRLICGLGLLWMSGLSINYLSQLKSVPAALVASARNYQAISTTPAIIAMFVVLARRQRRISLERAELQSEMYAAQEMQRLLVPAKLDVEPWLAMDVAYIPAKEVGGDFYYCSRTPAGQLIVLGDVSGKGLKAAMMASTAIGALRTEHSSDPAQVLALINKVVLSSGAPGFVTCICALFHADGTLEFANAGHLSPYRGGAALEAENGLPLGVLPDAQYETARYQINPGETVTLLSDGVAEATNAKGELFGFEKTAALTTKPAAEIARTAQNFGQEDDITVLTIRRLA
ncbi:MAG: serine/threonine-protein phosphatase [Candidatus Solibacter usitatus]|nr:serine/threonine-protein phosphatase [Candidatus Solibacter usitatus]